MKLAATPPRRRSTSVRALQRQGPQRHVDLVPDVTTELIFNGNGPNTTTHKCDRPSNNNNNNTTSVIAQIKRVRPVRLKSTAQTCASVPPLKVLCTSDSCVYERGKTTSSSPASLQALQAPPRKRTPAMRPARARASRHTEEACEASARAAGGAHATRRSRRNKLVLL
jgi:hypothetical protein